MSSNSLTGGITNGEKQKNGWRRYLTFSQDHKVIGVQYMLTTFIFFLIGGLLAMLIGV